MSASLVGSEMCIRDRPAACAGIACGWDAKGRQPPLRRGGAPDAWFGGAVSYTHLTLPTICSV
eukprot:11466571-Alexandrium_andersonii.AAC.1